MKKLYKILLLIVFLPTAPIYWLFRYIKGKKTTINYNNIVDGFANSAFRSAKIEKLAKSRAKICAACPFAKKSKVLKMITINNKTKEINGMYCDVCGCDISTKVRSQNDYCPRAKW